MGAACRGVEGTEQGRAGADLEDVEGGDVGRAQSELLLQHHIVIGLQQLLVAHHLEQQRLPRHTNTQSAPLPHPPAAIAEI